MTSKQLELFTTAPERTKSTSPKGYKGFYGFHKYWGKKPHEPLSFIIDLLTTANQVVLDPFVGSGTSGREALLLGRRFLGIDINPVAIELSRLLLHPPDLIDLKAAIEHIAYVARDRILESYLLEDGETISTHYLWDSDNLTKVWVSGKGRNRKRLELDPTPHDLKLIASFSQYRSKHVREPQFFANGRINASPRMSLHDLFTPRAQRSLDILIEAIRECPPAIQPSLMLCLTAASGQMTRMVFAVTGRGKTNGQQAKKTEVGSWVIGYWRPQLHFEVNAWNCFERRANKLIKAVSVSDALSDSVLSDDLQSVLQGRSNACLACGDAGAIIGGLPSESVDLVLTDPPHSDRMPYLELSELWNSILNRKPSFSDELVISNAKERDKSRSVYIDSLIRILHEIERVLAPRGFCIVLYNARQAEAWEAFGPLCNSDSGNNMKMKYVGCFPCEYSAGSVVQDNRKGSLKTDYAIVFRKTARMTSNSRVMRTLAEVPGWSPDVPPHINGEEIR